jgi:hypothetical protein
LNAINGALAPAIETSSPSGIPRQTNIPLNLRKLVARS